MAGMAVSTVFASVQEQMSKLQALCQALEAQNQLLTQELEKSRVENREVVSNLKEKVKKLESQLKRQNLDSRGIENGVSPRGPLNIFSDEVWGMIFDSVQDPKDLKSLYEAHPEFQPMIKDNKTKFLFSDVVKLLASNVSGFGVTSEYPVKSGDKVVQTAMNPLLQCRLVCREWKQSVDQFLQQESPAFTSIPETNCVVPAFMLSFPRNCYNEPRITQALNLNEHPMPGRYLVYRNDFGWFDISVNHQFEGTFGKFLKKFGKEVWTLKMSLGGRHSETATAFGYIPLLNQLSLTPNLKELYLCNPLPEWWDFYSESAGEEDSFEDYLDYRDKALKSSLLRSFPCLPLLKRIVFETCPPRLMQRILMANRQVEGLKIIIGSEKRDSYDPEDIQFLPGPNVTEAFLSFDGAWYIPRHWPLVKLTLDAKSSFDYKNLSNSEHEWSAKLGVSQTLQELDLRLYGPCDSLTELKLGLPALKILKLKLSEWFHPVDFILPLVNLEQLEIDFVKMRQTKDQTPTSGILPLKETDQVIKIHGYIDNLKQSNVWKLFPKLKQIKARTDWNPEDEEETVENPKWYLCRRDDTNT